MLIAKPCKTMVTGDEQIVSRDVVIVDERRPVTWHDPGIVVPPFLDFRIETSPSLQCPQMDRLSFRLWECAGELRMRPPFPKADAIPMVEGHLAY